jgi:predicted permease
LTLFTDVVLPILVVIAIGAFAHRRFRLHVPTLSKLTIYLFVPAFLFIQVYESDLGWGEIGGIVAVVAITLLVVGVPLTFALRRAGLPGPTVGALLLGGLLANAGNVGVPVAQFFYDSQGAVFPGMSRPEDGLAVQALVLMTANLSIWLLGYAVLAAANGQGLRGTLGFFRLPMIYVVVAAFVLRDLDVALPPAVLDPVRMLGVAVVPFMLIILGAQLVDSGRLPRWRRIGLALVVKLLLVPVVTGLVSWALGLWPWPGAQLVIAAAAPTAINIVLLSVELDGDAGTAADCVFWSTLLSGATLTATMAVVLQIAG